MSVVWGERNAQMHFPFDFCCVFLCLLFGGKGMCRCIPFDFCCVFLCLLFGGKGMRRCIPFDFCFAFLCLLFGGRECADAFRLISVLSFYVCCLGEGNAQMHFV